MEVIRMSEITYLKSPITVDIGDWMLKNSGLVALAKRVSDKRKASIYAFQKSDVATIELKTLAKDDDLILVGTLNEDVNAID